MDSLRLGIPELEEVQQFADRILHPEWPGFAGRYERSLDVISIGIDWVKIPVTVAERHANSQYRAIIS